MELDAASAKDRFLVLEWAWVLQLPSQLRWQSVWLWRLASA